MSNILEVRKLRAIADNQEILKGLDLELPTGQVHALMGPNGSGKSTLAQVLMGHPGYETSGSVTFAGADLLALAPNERARAGLFLAWQYPPGVPGVTLGGFLREAYNAVHEEKLTPARFSKLISDKLDSLGMAENFLERSVNEGWSGGEKKKAEVLQMLVLEPRLAILDETDSGLDIDALKIVARGINSFIKNDGSASPLDQRTSRDAALGDISSPKSSRSVLLITHYQRILDYVQPDYVHIMVGGEIVKSGGPELARELESAGYNELVKHS